MIYLKHIPKYPLDNFIEALIYIEGNNRGTGLPKTAMSLVFNLGDSFKLFTDETFTACKDYNKYWVAGLQTKPTHVESYGTSKMLLIQFKTTGAFVFFNEPLYYYTDNYITLNHIFTREADETWEQLMESNSIQEKFLITENFIYRKLLMNKLPNKKLLSAIDILVNEGSDLSIEALSKQLNISRKHLNDLSKQYIGVSPKMLTSLYRFQRTIKKISTSRPNKLSDVAYHLDYFDQAHFNNDFKRFTHLKPSAYVNLVANNPSLQNVPHFIPHE